jgi:hypothetical protein
MYIDEYFWPYLAGFFDGEGNISVLAPAPTVTIAQSGEGGKVLIESLAVAIKAELDRRKLRGSIHVIAWRPNPKNTRSLAKTPKNALVSYRLSITHRDAVGFVLSSMLPFLKMKKVAAQDLLRFFRIFPKMKSTWTRKRAERCHNGHPFTVENTALSKDSDRYGQRYRYCKICNKASRQRRAGVQ